MNEPGTKSCRHCGEPILQVARICKHCHSSQGWFAGNRDPRYTFVVLGIMGVIFVAALTLLSRVKTKRDRRVDPDLSCRGLVSVKTSAHFTRLVEGRERLF